MKTKINKVIKYLLSRPKKVWLITLAAVIFVAGGLVGWYLVDAGMKNVVEEVIAQDNDKKAARNNDLPAAPDAGKGEGSQTAEKKDDEKPDVAPNSDGQSAPTNEQTQPSQPSAPPPGQPQTPTPPTPPVQPPVQPPAPDPLTEVLNIVNAERAAVGAGPLAIVPLLSQAAQVRAVEAASVFSHTRPNGSQWSTVLGEYGISYSMAGENLALGNMTPAQVMQGWMNSAGHRANILNPSYTQIGLGKSGNSWVQLFLRP
ncbi:CAP domain-containing protein [Candidatus Saccharibacteria bacterium]|nr:CAP domain-containing protein [Candidatus Saccharibacteria bacterium]